MRDAGGGYHERRRDEAEDEDRGAPSRRVGRRRRERLRRRPGAAAHRAGRGHRPGLERLPASPRSSSASLVVVLDRLRRRALPPPRRPRCPARSASNIPLEVAYTVVPLLIVGVLFAVTFVSVERHRRRVDDDPDLVVEVTASSGSGSSTTRTSGVARHRHRRRDARARAAGRRHGALRPDVVDVIHSFWIPGFRFKRDMFPGQTQSFQVDVGDAHRRRARHRRVRRVLRARPPQDALLRAHRDARRVRRSGCRSGREEAGP